eukprot:jgi/Tetstr1/437376/TSEL_026060.t1
MESTLKAEEKAVMSAVFDECWPRDTQIPLASLRFGGTPIVSSVQRNKAGSLPLAGTAASPKLHGLVGVLAQQKRAGGIIKHNTSVVKNLAATQAVPGANVDEGSSPEPPAKKAKPAAGTPSPPPPSRSPAGPGPGPSPGPGSGEVEMDARDLDPIAAEAKGYVGLLVTK